MRRRASASAIVLVAALLALALLPATGLADFPYAPGGDPHDPLSFHLAPGVVPNDFSEGDWKFTATPDAPSANPLTAKVNNQTDELCGVRGMSLVDAATTQPPLSCATGPVHTAWQVSTGRPDVIIDVLDSGIEWNDPNAMRDLAGKVHLNQGELPAPRRDHASIVPGLGCATFHAPSGGDYNPHGNYDVNGDGVFNVRDYACDSRVAAVVLGGNARHGLRHGPDGILTPEDLILAFSDGQDHDHNGFRNDIAGWNFVDDNNDPFDDVQYGHGTGEARDSNAEAGNGGDLGSCPNCMVVPLRVGESFVADANRFAQAVLYGTDNGASVIQEALGTVNAPRFARQAIEYAYHHGVSVIASAADEAAEHHNQPGALPDTILVNSVTKYSSFTSTPPSYLQFNGCTNFSTHLIVAVPSSSCSSEATGKAAGVAGLIYSAAENAIAEGRMRPSADCRRVDGSPCPVTANEVRQLIGSGDVGSRAPADTGTGQSDDVNFASQPESSCAAKRPATCTDPNRQISFAADQLGGAVGPFPRTTRYPARKGFDEFYGYGRLNAFRAVNAAGAGNIPPQAEITGPDWFQQIDPASGSLPVTGSVGARSAYTCEVDVAPGGQPNSAGDFHPVSSGWCNGSSHSGSYSGTLGVVDLGALKAMFPPSNPGDFRGNENGGIGQDTNGRPNTMPYAFTVRVVVRTASGLPMSGEDRRQAFLHRDRDMLPGFPIELRADGDSSPLLVDINGDNRNELIVATGDGWVHAYRRDGKEVRGWPVHAGALPDHGGERAYGDPQVGGRHYAAILGALAAGDLFGDGRTEIVADDNMGNVWAWDPSGRVVFHRTSNPKYSGAPLAPFQTVRRGVRDRTEHGFLASPVLAHLSGGCALPPATKPRPRLHPKPRRHRAPHQRPSSRAARVRRGEFRVQRVRAPAASSAGCLDVIAASDDRHVYAWQPNGQALPGFPVLVADPDKVASVDPVTHHITFRNVSAKPGLEEDQGKIIDTPAVATIGGHKVIVVGTNEEYPINTGDEGGINVAATNSLLTSTIGKAGLLPQANGRVYAIKADGTRSGNAFLPGWPHKVGIIDAGLLPDVGEGVNGSPVVAPVNCPSGGGGMKIGVTPDAGPAYVLNGDGSSCYGQTSGADNTLSTDLGLNTSKYDTPTYAAVGYPAFGSLDGKTVSLFAPVTGLIRALDVVAPEYQGGQDFIMGWNPSLAAAQTLAGFPAEVNDLQFLTGQAVGQLSAGASQQVIGGTSSLDLQAFGAGGSPPSSAWPKLTGDWTVATPTLGSFGTLDTAPAARKDVVSITRSGTLAVYGTPAGACTPSSSPRFHHDDANSGDYTRDAVPPGRPMNGRVLRRRGKPLRMQFTAPGGDLLCGRAAAYQMVTSNAPVTAQSFGSARRLAVSALPLSAGQRQVITLPRRLGRFVAIRAIDAAGNLGLPLVVRISLGPRRRR